MQNVSTNTMTHGSHNTYFWFQTFDTNLNIDKFLREFKQHLENKYVCISAFDSGKIHISSEEKKLGWRNLDNVAISPAIKIDTAIPTAGFDEWYIFIKQPLTITLSDIYVNYSSFNLSDNSDMIKKFWQDIEFNQPIIYISEGDSLIIVTLDTKLKEDIEKYWC